MTTKFIDLSTLELDGNHLEQVKSRLELYKLSLETDPSFSWLSIHDEALRDADEILQNINDWEMAKKFIDSRIKDNEDHILVLRDLLVDIPKLFEKDLDNEEEEEQSFVISSNQLKKIIGLGEISCLQGTVTRETGKVESLFLNRNDKIRPPVNTFRDGDTFEIHDIVVDIAGNEMEMEAVEKLVTQLFPN